MSDAQRSTPKSFVPDPPTDRRISVESYLEVSRRASVAPPPAESSAPARPNALPPLPRPRIDMQPVDPRDFERGARRGVAQAGAGLLDPKNLALMAGTVGAGFIPFVGPAIAVGAGAYFTYEMAKALLDSIPEAKNAWDRGDYGRLGEIVGQDAVAGLMTALGAKGVKAGVQRGLLKPVPTAGTIQEMPLSAAGEARLRAANPPGAPGPVTTRTSRRARVQPPSTGRHQFEQSLVDPVIANRRRLAKRLGMDYDTMSPKDQAALDEIGHELNIGAMQNATTEPPAWWPTTAKLRPVPESVNVPRESTAPEAAAGAARPGEASASSGIPPVPGSPESLKSPEENIREGQSSDQGGTGKIAPVPGAETVAPTGTTNANGTAKGTAEGRPGTPTSHITAAPAARQPWEMTRDEYAGPRPPARDKPGVLTAQQAAWMSRYSQHPQIVKDALHSGKSVPPEVLAEYPGLLPPVPGNSSPKLKL